MKTTKKPNGADDLSADLLFGAEEIGHFLGQPPAWVYYQVSKGNLAVARIGTQIVGSRSKLRRLLTGETTAA
jgi:hypothetical protein